MTIPSIRATAVAALLAAASVTGLSAAFAADAPAPAGPKLTSGVAKGLQEAQKAMAANDNPTALAAIKKAQDVTGRTPYDDFMINRFLMSVDIKLKDMDGAAVAGEATADSPAIPADQKAEVYHNGLVLALNAKHYDKAVTYAKNLAAVNPNPDERTQEAIDEAYYFGNDYADAEAAIKKQVDAAGAAGQKPSKNALDILLQIQVKQKDEAGAEQTLEIRTAAFNDPADWVQMIDITLGTKGMRDLDALYLGRLLFATGAKVSPQDATIVGQTASHLTFFGDAVNAQQAGGTGFPDVSAKAAADKKSMPAQIAAGAKQGGQYNVKLAEALYGYGMFPEAETAAKLAQTKGGATDASEVPMMIGMAQVAQGKYADAIASFGTVQGGGPATPRVVRLWTDFAKIKANPPAPAAAAAQ